MKVIIKTLKKVEYNVEVASDEITVKELKNEIEKTHNFDSGELKLLYKGVVLVDTKTLKEYDIKEETVLIMMNTKAKIKNAPIPGKEEEKKEEAKKEEVKKEEENKSEKKKPEYEREIGLLIDMGFEREQAEKAIRAAKGNLDKASDYCINGIPKALENLDQEENTEVTPLKKIASIVKCICRDNPSAFAPLLQNLGENDPELLNLIKENEEEFKRLIATPVTDEDLQVLRNYSAELGLPGLGGMGMGMGMGMGHLGGHSGSGLGGGLNQINFTDEEKAAINRLKELGNFREEDVIQAYLACDKNEELAANYLFEHNMN